MLAKSPLGQESKHLFAALISYEKAKFTGCVEIRARAKHIWRFHFSSGWLAWLDGGMHPWRSWHRQLAILNDARVKARAAQLEDRQELTTLIQQPLWSLLTKLLSDRELNPKQFEFLLGGLCRESLFDLIWELEQCEPGTSEINAFDKVPLLVGYKVPPTLLVATGPLCARVHKDWIAWQAAALANFANSHVNQAPVIAEPKQLATAVTPAAFQRMNQLLNGTRTFRDIARAINKSEAALMQMFEPYLKSGWLRLENVPDTAPARKQKAIAPPVRQQQATQRTIACVDDSPQVLALVELVAKHEGYEFVGIGDSLQAMPLLLEKKPDLIFLDVVMPGLNGYELCQRLKRIDLFAQTPILLLSSNTIDLANAKAIGACECLEKPVSPRQLKSALERHTLQKCEALVA